MKSFVFDKAKDSWVCSVHGEVDSVGWVPCWNGCCDSCYTARTALAEYAALEKK